MRGNLSTSLESLRYSGMLAVIQSLPRISTNNLSVFLKWIHTIRAQTIAYVAYIPIPHTPESHFTPIVMNEVGIAVTVSKSRAMGRDNISRTMIINILAYSFPVVTNVIIFSLDSDDYPTLWEKAFVRPIPKVPHSQIPHSQITLALFQFYHSYLKFWNPVQSSNKSRCIYMNIDVPWYYYYLI